MLKKWIVFVFTAIFMLSACNSPVYNQTENNVADVKLKTRAARQKSDESGKVPPSLVMNKGLYVDKTPISLYRNPSWLKDHIVIKGEQLPFSYYSRTVAGGAGHGILTRYQSGLDQSVKISMNYSGTVQGALEVLSARTGYNYVIHGNSVYWQAFITKTFDVAFLPGGTDYLVGRKGGTTSSNTGAAQGVQNFTTSDGSMDEYSNMGGKLSVWKDLSNTVQQMLTPDGKVIVSEATTSVTVRDRPSNVSLVGQYLANLNTNLAKQVLVKVQILQVQLSSMYNMGIDWQIVAKAFHNSPFALNASYGTPISLTTNPPFVAQATLPGSLLGPFGASAGPPGVPELGTVGNGKIPSYTILINALSQQGKTSVVTEPRVVALNNQVSVIKLTTQQGYLASIQNTTLSGTSGTAPTSTVTTQLTPGNLITGFTFYILPKIIKDKIVLQVNADLSVNTNISEFGPPNNQIQLPTVNSQSFNQRSVVRSGETMILAGFRQLTNTANATQFLKSQALGGKGSNQTSNETVVLITPIILPSGNLGEA